MSDKINVEAILNKYSIAKFGEPDKGKSTHLNHDTVKAAIKEIVEAVIDKCTKEGRIKCLNQEPCSECEYHILDKESILSIKKEIEYE